MNKKQKKRKNNGLKFIVSITAALIVCIGALMFFNQKNKKTSEVAEAAVDVQPKPAEDTKAQDTKEENNNEEADNDKKENKNETEDKNQNSSIKSDTPEFIQKYIEQQAQGMMPEGADGTKAVYLTFDDGPSTSVTPQVLDILKSENVNATFFVLGKEVDSSEESKQILKRMYDEGNAIGIHTYSHDYEYLYPGRTVNVDNFASDVNKTVESLKAVLGSDFTTKAIRMPGGHMSWNGTAPLDEWFKENGYSTVDWNALTKDAEGEPKQAPQLVEEAKNTTGSMERVILLMHDTYGKEESAKALRDVIQFYKSSGYEFRVIR